MPLKQVLGKIIWIKKIVFEENGSNVFSVCNHESNIATWTYKKVTYLNEKRMVFEKKLLKCF